MSIASRLAAPLAVLAVTVLALAACGTSPSPSPSPTVESGVRGISLIVGGPAPGGPRPDPGPQIAIHRGSLHGPVVARIRTDAHGKFSVSLKPGRYTLVQLSDSALPKTVTVPAHGFVSVKLLIEAM